jgi:hypothetical protein
MLQKAPAIARELFRGACVGIDQPLCINEFCHVILHGIFIVVSPVIRITGKG